MNKQIEKKIRRKTRVRGKISGTSLKPRLSVFRSNSHIYAQLIDDVTGITLVSSSDLKTSVKGSNKQVASEVGKALGGDAVKKGIKTVVFDRNGNKYHGRIKALADGARESGLIF